MRVDKAPRAFRLYLRLGREIPPIENTKFMNNGIEEQ